MEEIDEKDLEELKKQINETKNGNITGNIKNINYEINLNRPMRVVFKDEKNEIEFYSGKLASSKIELDREEKRVHYRKKNALNVGITLIRIVSVIQSEINNKNFISEKYYIKEQFDDNMVSKKSSKIIEDLLQNNSILKSINEGEFIREPIENDEQLISIIHPEEDLDKYLIEGSKTKLGDFLSGFYEDRHDFEFNKKNKDKNAENISYEEFVEKANNEINFYKNLLNKIENLKDNTEGIEGIEEQQEVVKEDIDIVEVEEENEGKEITDIDVKTFVKHFKENQLEDENEQENVTNEEELNQNEQEKVFEAADGIEKETSDEVLVNSLNKLVEQKRLEELQQIRAAKINKVKELIDLNKQLDNELNIIENGIKGEN